MGLSDAVISTLVTIFLTLLSLVLSVLILRIFLSFTKTSKFVFLMTLLGYFLGFFLLILMPLDVGTTSYLSCLNATNDTSSIYSNTTCRKPFNHVEPEVLRVLWSLIYWISFNLTWLIYPFMTSYVSSGEFRVLGKIKASIKENLVFYGVAVVACVVLFIIMFIVWKTNLANETMSNMAISNMILQGVKSTGYGLVFVPRHYWRMGYGLVFVPRHYWRMGDRQLLLQHAQSKLAHYYDSVDENASTLNLTLKLLRQYDLQMDKEHENRVYLNEILQEHTPPEYGSFKVGEGETNFDYDSLVELNAKIQWDTKQYNTARVLFDETFKEAIMVDDIIKALNSGWRKKFSFRETGGRVGWYASTKEFIGHAWIVIAPFFWRLLSILFAFISATLVYSECVIVFAYYFPDMVDISFYGFLTTKAGNSPIGMEILTFILVSYLAFCTYSALFKVELFSFYKLLPHQQTDETSILFSAAYLSRLIAPLAYNFLHIINFTKTAFPSPFILVMTPGADNRDQIQEKVFVALPLMLLVICIFTIFNLCNKIMSLFGLNRVSHFFRVCCTDDFNDEEIDRGVDIMNKERDAKARYTTTVRRICTARVFDQTASEEKTMEQTIVDLDNVVLQEDESSLAYQSTPVQKVFDFFGFATSSLGSVASATINSFSFGNTHKSSPTKYHSGRRSDSDDEGSDRKIDMIDFNHKKQDSRDHSKGKDSKSTTNPFDSDDSFAINSDSSTVHRNSHKTTSTSSTSYTNPFDFTSDTSKTHRSVNINSHKPATTTTPTTTAPSYSNPFDVPITKQKVKYAWDSDTD